MTSAADSSVTKAVVLAAGRGTRLGDLTAQRPKPLLPVSGKPLLEHILTGLGAAGIREALIIIGYLGQQIVDYFGDGGGLGLRLTYAWQAEARGTGAALMFGRDFAASHPIVMSYGDILTHPAHYRDLLQDYANEACAALLGINPMEDVSAGAAVVREGRRIVRILEKPPPGAGLSKWNQAGVTVFSSLVWPVLSELRPSARGEVELTAAVAALIDAGRPVRAHEFTGFWSDVGTPEALVDAQRRWPEAVAGSAAG